MMNDGISSIHLSSMLLRSVHSLHKMLRASRSTVGVAVIAYNSDERAPLILSSETLVQIITETMERVYALYCSPPAGGQIKML